MRRVYSKFQCPNCEIPLLVVSGLDSAVDTEFVCERCASSWRLQEMIGKKELKKFSNRFKKRSRRLLESKSVNEANRNLRDFIYFIDEETISSEYLDGIKTRDYDIESALREKEPQRIFSIPMGKNEKTTFLYQLLKYTVEKNLSYIDLCSFYRQAVEVFCSIIMEYIEELEIDMGFDESKSRNLIFQGNVGQLAYAEGQQTVTQNYTQSENRRI